MRKLIVVVIMLFMLSSCDLLNSNDVPACDEGYFLNEKNVCVEEDQTTICEQGYILDENDLCILDEVPLICEEGFVEGDGECIVDQDLVNQTDFITLLENYEDITFFASTLQIDEEIYMIITNDEDITLLETTTTSITQLDMMNQIINMEIELENLPTQYMQVFTHNGNLVSIIKTYDTYEVFIDEMITFEEYVSDDTSLEKLSEKPINEIEKVDDTEFIVTYTKSDFYTDAQLDSILGANSMMTHDEMTKISVRYDFSNISDKKIVMEITMDGIIYLDNYTTTIIISQIITIPEALDINLLVPEGQTIEPAKSLDQVFLVFEPDEMVYFNQTDGDNIIAFHLPPGDYAVYNEASNITSNAYLIIYNENRSEVVPGTYLHIEEETTMYFNFTSYGGWTQEDRPIMLKSITALHDGETNYENISGTITLDFTEVNMQHVLVFPDATFNGLIIFESDDINQGNNVTLFGDTRCTNTVSGDTCAIKTYDGADITISITAHIPDTITFSYRLVEQDDVSNDQNNPVSLDSIENGVVLESNTDYYFTFDSIGDTFRFVNDVLQPGYYVTSTVILYDSSGNIVSSNWQGPLELEAGTYIISLQVFGGHSAVFPRVEIVE